MFAIAWKTNCKRMLVLKDLLYKQSDVISYFINKLTYKSIFITFLIVLFNE